MFKQMETGDEVIKHLLQELTIHANVYKITYLREWCSLPNEEEYTGGTFGELSQTFEQPSSDPFLFHALKEPRSHESRLH